MKNWYFHNKNSRNQQKVADRGIISSKTQQPLLPVAKFQVSSISLDEFRIWVGFALQLSHSCVYSSL